MGNQAENISCTVEQLSEQVKSLNAKIEHLSARISAMEHAAPVRQQDFAAEKPVAARAARVQEGPPPLVDTSLLLTRVATICFLLVIALILRTITDNQLINTQAGSILGMAYAGILILLGWPLYARNSRLAPVFPGCGILLLFSIILETHAHYESLSTRGAYILLFAAGAMIFAMSIRHRATALVCLGVPGSAAVALAVNFPYPIYPLLATLLLCTVIAASYAFKQQMCRYLRWFVLILAALFWMLWTSKINTIPYCAEPVAAAMYPDWFFPMLFIFWGTYLITVVLNVLKKDLQLGIFESIIPTLTAAGAFAAGNIAVSNWFLRENWFYILIFIIAALHLVLAWRLARHDRQKATGSNVFILAGACLIILLTATVFRRDLGYVLPIWSGSALFLGLLSASWHNQGVRLTSYLMQTVACATAIFAGVIVAPYASPAAAALSAGTICLFSLVHYRRSRTQPPDQSHSLYFRSIDRHDYSAVLLLTAGVLAGYFFCQVILYQALQSIPAGFADQFRSGQSLIINTGALVLMFIALKNRNKELILAASIVALIGTGKVFLLDMFSISGVPLVLSVFSTGIVAAGGSIVLGKWQKKKAEGVYPSAL